MFWSGVNLLLSTCLEKARFALGDGVVNIAWPNQVMAGIGKVKMKERVENLSSFYVRNCRDINKEATIEDEWILSNKTQYTFTLNEQAGSGFVGLTRSEK